jgi:hypothetical protein
LVRVTVTVTTTVLARVVRMGCGSCSLYEGGDSVLKSQHWSLSRVSDRREEGLVMEK